MNIHVAKDRAPKYMKQKQKEEIDKCTIIVVDSNTPLSN